MGIQKATPKYLFFDIDGTIARNDQPPSQETTEAIRRARANGHKAFICTARTICDVYDSLFEVGFDGIIAGAGAQIIIDGKEIYHHYIPEDVLIRTVEGFYAHNFSGVLEGTDQIYFVPGEVELTGDFPRLKGIADVNGDLKIEKFTIHTFDHAHIWRVVRQMPELLDWYDMYANNSGSFGEFVWKGIDKASGIRRVAEYYGASMEDTIAFGDSMNDAAAIDAAGTGVVMGDSPDELKEMADLVTGTLEEEGIARALQKLHLIKKQEN